MKDKIFWVQDSAGSGYAEPMDWIEASSVAIELNERIPFVAIYDEVDDKVVAIYHDGQMYVSTGGKVCEHCGKAVSAEQVHYTFVLTDHIFCSQKCGIALGVLFEPR